MNILNSLLSDKGTLLADRTLETPINYFVANILNAYDDMVDISGGLNNIPDWYQVESEDLMSFSKSVGISMKDTCDVTSALSPRIEWSQNKQAAKDLITVYLRDGYISAENFTIPATDTNKHKAIGILRRKVYLTDKSRKTYNFSLNLQGDVDALTIDRHAIGIACGSLERGSVKISNPVYDFLSEAYIWAAVDRKVSNCRMQSVTWAYALLKKKGK